MTRATEAFTTAAIVTAIYLVLFFGVIPLPETIQYKIIPVVREKKKEIISAFNDLYISFHGGHS